jgi:phage-related tail protein
MLQDLADEQQSVAESQLELATNQLATLDAQAETAQAYYANQLQLAQHQVNELRGINNSVLTVAEAMSSLGAALNTSRTVASASGSSGSNLTAQITQMYLEFLGRTPEAAGLQNWLSSGRDAAGIREGIVNSDEYRVRHGGIPAYANGGAYPGGLAMVGEQGPELINFARPGQVYTAGQTASILGGGTEVAEEIRGLRKECQAQARAMVQMQNRMTRLLERWDGSGMPETREVSA